MTIKDEWFNDKNKLKAFVSDWLDDENLLSNEMIRKRNWFSIPVADVLNPMEAEWLADTLASRGVNEVVGISFEFECDPIVDVFEPNRDSILRFNSLNNEKYVLITSKEVGFFYFKDQNNRFFILCGDSEFINGAYKCSYDTAKTMYLDYWVESDFNSKSEKEYLINIWKKYTN